MPERKVKEAEFVSKLFELLSAQTALGSENLKMGTEVPIPYKLVCLPEELQVWCSNQDIAICQPIVCSDSAVNGLPIKFKYSVKANSCLIQVDSEEVEIITSETDKDIDKELNLGKGVPSIPFLIIEAKLGSQSRPTTDAILAAAKKSEMIKEIFPFCYFLLIIFGTENPRTSRLGDSAFNKIITIQGDTPENIELPEGFISEIILRNVKIAKQSEMATRGLWLPEV